MEKLMSKIFRRKVQYGQKRGRTIGFPTLNFTVGSFSNHVRRGVYTCRVWHQGKSYQGLLHFGHTLKSKKPTLEVYVHHFHQCIYGQWVSFQVEKKIRNVQLFSSLATLKKQLQKDIKILGFANIPFKK
jgi:riboflavin kinase / FMN adenylyltransferase